jgi:hypothetical protein
MTRTLPLDHPLVRTVARAIGEAMVLDNPAMDGPWTIGTRGLEIIAELVSASLPSNYVRAPEPFRGPV